MGNRSSCTFRTRPILAVLLAVTIGVACGSGGGDDDADDADRPGPTEPTEPTDEASGPAAEPTEPALQQELLEMHAADQAERTTDSTVNLDAERTARLEEIIEEYGWPTWDLVGRDGGTAAWLIAQHSDQDVDFQRQALDLLRDAVEDVQADPTELAYLEDRVAVNSGDPQRYGTQVRCTVEGEPEPQPIEDSDEVDERRAEVGLGPLDEYLAEFEAGCGVG